MRLIILLCLLSPITLTDYQPKMNFKDALALVLKHEGGYVNHPKDPGGETNYGVTKTTAAKFGYTGDMKDIPLSVVEQIYLKGYWQAINGEALPDALRHHVFDAAVNSGPVRAIKWLQQALGTKDDGVFGNDTYSRLQTADPVKLAAKYNAIRLKFLAGLPTFSTFGAGWTKRVASNLEEV